MSTRIWFGSVLFPPLFPPCMGDNRQSLYLVFAPEHFTLSLGIQINPPIRQTEIYLGRHPSRIPSNPSLFSLHLISRHTLVGDTASGLWMLFGTEGLTRRKKKQTKNTTTDFK